MPRFISKCKAHRLEPKRIKKAFRESEERYHRIVETANEGIWTVDQDKRTTFVNQKMAEMLGYSVEEMLDRSFFNFIEVEDYAKMEEIFRHYIQGSKEQFELEFRCRDGSVIWTIISGSPICNADGGYIGALGMITDITARKLADNALMESEKRFHSIFNNTSVGVVMTDQDGQLVNVNQAMCSILGYAEEELIGAHITSFTYAEDQGRNLEHHRALMAGEADSCIYQNRFIRKNGGIVWARLNVSVIKDDNSAPQYELVVVEDITSLIVVEKEMKAEHRIYNAMLGALEDASPPVPSNPEIGNLAELVMTLKDKGGYEEAVAERVLKEVCEVTGADKGAYSSYFSYGEHAENLHILCTVGFSEAVNEKFKQVYNFTPGEKGWLAGYVAYTQKALYLPDILSEPRWGLGPVIDASMKSCYVVPLSYGEKLFGVYTLFSHQVDGFSKEQRYLADTLTSYISSAIENARLFEETQRAYDSLNKVQQQLFQVQKMNAIGQLAGGLAHELNNQLTIIHGCVDLYSRQLTEDDPLWDAFVKIRNAAWRSANLTRQLLFFGTRQPQHKAPLDINQNIVDLTDMLTGTIGEDIKICLELSEDLPMASADTANIDQVLVNLVLNARDAMPSGGILTVRTRAVEVDQAYCAKKPEACPGRFVYLEVGDTGTGISEENMSRLFEPFFTTKVFGKGTGLGLSVVYGIVKSHEGWIDVASTVGQGASFQIFLPVGQQETELEAGSEKLTKIEDNRGAGELILLVEDDPDVRTLTQQVLAENGYTVSACGSASEAVRIFKQENAHFHLLLSDVLLPDGRGTNLALQLREWDPVLAILLVSGYTDERANPEAINRLGMFFMAKPFTAETILREIKNVLTK
jgi:PAS domain S-box-containing protein